MQPRTIFQPNTSLIFQVIFCIGIFSTIAICIGLLIAVAYLINLAMMVVSELSYHIGMLYNHADSFTQLLLLCIIGYCLYRVARFVFRKQVCS